MTSEMQKQMTSETQNQMADADFRKALELWRYVKVSIIAVADEAKRIFSEKQNDVKRETGQDVAISHTVKVESTYFTVTAEKVLLWSYSSPSIELSAGSEKDHFAIPYVMLIKILAKISLIDWEDVARSEAIRLLDSGFKPCK